MNNKEILDEMRIELYAKFGGKSDYESWVHETVRKISQSIEEAMSEEAMREGGNPKIEAGDMLLGLDDGELGELIDAYTPSSIGELYDQQYDMIGADISKGLVEHYA